MTPPPVTVLLIEDDPGDVDFLQELLTEAPSPACALEHTDRLAAGLARLAASAVDVVLLDLSLPDSQGLDTVVRVQAAAPTVPIVVLTGLEDDTTALRAVQAGAQDYLPKGDLDRRTLLRVIRYAIERQRADTTRQHLEAQLRQAQKMEAIGTLASGIAHDFNNILAASLGYTELALDEIAADSAAWDYLQEVLIANTRARDLVQQILTFSHQSTPERIPMTLSATVSEALTLLRASLPAMVDIRPSLASDAGTVLADATQIYQIVMNLCTNATHAMGAAGGVLQVSLQAVEVDGPLASQYGRDPGPYTCLRVQDTGTGIPPHVLDHLFEPFFTTKAQGEGTGLGLAVVYGLVSDHDGFITVASTLGEGSTFSLYFPRLDTVARAVVAPPERLPGGQECILFVDDEPALARLGKKYLTRLGYEVAMRTSSLEALEAFRAAPQRFDLVITDHTMPHMTGETLAGELRRLRSDIPIILCTGFSHQRLAERAERLRLDAVCMKPLVAAELHATIRRVLAARRTSLPGDPHGHGHAVGPISREGQA